MKTFVLVSLAVMFMFVGVAQAVDVTGYARFGYVVDSNVDNQTVSVTYDPDYVLDSELTLGFTDSLAVRLGLNTTENASINYSAGVDYFIGGSPFGVFIEHTEHDMKAGLPDFDVTWAGITARLK